MIKVACDYNIKEDIGFILESEKINNIEFAERAKVSRTTLEGIVKKGIARDDVCEKIYAYAYNNKYRINSVKEELIKEKSCVYSFRYSLLDLKIKKFECDLEWMLAICYYRGTLGEYVSNSMVREIVNEIEKADIVIAPIADNKMFYIMAQFTEGEINADVALHSLSASKLGRQFIFKTEKALQNLVPIEKYYLSVPERKDCRKVLNERSYEIDTKLKLAKREFKTGLYIEEILK